ncbi:MAG: LD-carboxypeptidase [Bacteroidia bacterium]|nr:LD-carboxypeptidase [Bacteroidia bacterium]
MIWPPPLRRGDRVALIAASRRVTPAEIRPFLAFAQLQGWKIEYEEKNLYASDGLLAGSDNHRLQLLQSAIEDPTLRAIWFARGGYGSSRIWPQLSWSTLQRYPKWLIGFSDVTPFLWAAARVGVVALHAPVAAYLPHKTHIEAINRLLEILRGETQEYVLSWDRKPWYSWRPGEAQGHLLGGNLTLLQSLCGTTLDLSHWEGSPLLFWEEIGEYYYRLDRMTWHLHNAGWYDRSVGLLVGDLSYLRDDEDIPFGRSPKEIVDESTNSLAPVAMGLKVGHSFQNFPLPVGVQAYLSVTENNATLRIPIQL